jgi:hypothetical protein
MYHQILPAQTAAGDPEAVVGAPVACSLWLNFHFFFSDRPPAPHRRSPWLLLVVVVVVVA